MVGPETEKHFCPSLVVLESGSAGSHTCSKLDNFNNTLQRRRDFNEKKHRQTISDCNQLLTVNGNE